MKQAITVLLAGLVLMPAYQARFETAQRNAETYRAAVRDMRDNVRANVMQAIESGKHHTVVYTGAVRWSDQRVEIDALHEKGYDTHAFGGFLSREGFSIDW